MITRVGVVVPVHDEAELLPACLASLQLAAARCPVPVEVVVALDSCTDASLAVCRAHGVATVEVAVRSVGLARAAGIAALRHGWGDATTLWLAGTDADCVVPPDWLSEQVRLADAGADAVLGLVEVLDGPAELLALHRSTYDMHPRHSHPHVHGANLGLRGITYLAAGGFPAVAEHEDHALLAAVAGVPRVSIVRSTTPRVLTSGRLEGRCREGFAAHLAGLRDGARAS